MFASKKKPFGFHKTKWLLYLAKLEPPLPNIQNVFKEGELNEEMVCRNFRHTTQHGAIEGKTQEVSVKLYNLDVIISVGYRVKSTEHPTIMLN
jgi:hypothetical protein